jgi:secondary thiamine-phosphate synthase enzyme
VKRIEVKTGRSQEMVDVTAKVKHVIKDSGVSSGTCIVFVPHTTAGVTINENADPDVQRDILAALEKIVPTDGKYHHVEGNAHAHVKSSIIGCQTMILIESGRLVLGTWQGIFLCEFDGPRTRTLLVKVTGK